MKNFRKHFYWSESRNSISIEVGYFPMIKLGIDFGEDITITIGCFIQFYFSLDVPKLDRWLYKYKIHDRALEIYLYTNDFSIHLNLMSDTMGWKKGDWKWSLYVIDKLRGKYEVSKKVIEERDISIPMPEKNYPAHAILADWTWTYPRWFSKTIRRCEIKIPGGLPHEGKGENSYDCGQDATFSIATKAKTIPEGVGQLVGSVLKDRVKYGGWGDYNWTKLKTNI